jgi:hypothetical protein
MPFYFPSSQDSKPEIVDKNDILYVNFLEKDINIINPYEGPKIMSYYLVTDETAMRPDLCARDMYVFEQSFIENMLKFNNISNPFTLAPGDILGTFDPYSMTKNTRNTSVSLKSRDQVRKQYITPEKKSQSDPKFTSFDKRNKEKKKPSNSTMMPPNFAAFGDKEIEIRGGKIFFGECVSKPQGNDAEPLSKSEFISKLIKNRLNNK